MVTMYALRTVTNLLGSSSNNIKTQDNLNITHAGYIYGSRGDIVNWKKKSSTRDTLEILEAMDKLDKVNGNETYIHDPLEKRYNDFLTNESEAYKADVLFGKQKHIILLMSDWQTQELTKASKYIWLLRDLWVVVSGIGITNDWQNMKPLFADANPLRGKWVICESPKDLWQTMHEIVSDSLINVDENIS